MKALRKNYLLQDKFYSLLKKKILSFIIITFLMSIGGYKAQLIGNYVNNGSFELFFNSGISSIPYFWGGIDSSKYFGELLRYPNKVPKSSFTYQWPYDGNNYFISTIYLNQIPTIRGYPKNRMKHTLEAGHSYCVSFYVNLTNQSTHGIDAISAYFSDNYLDTIKKCNIPLTYLTPQIENTINNIITDTLNWVPITGTFVANGTEKYMLIGNFKSDSNTHKTLVNLANLPSNFSDYLIDAVSVIEVDLHAYAGPDKLLIPGDSVYIGREPDFAIDPGCRWYQFPNMATPINTISGMWVKPTVTTTYVVRQILDCSAEKWDTVVVYMNPLGLVTSSGVEKDIKLFPNPASDFLEISVSNPELLKDFKTLSIYNNLGQLVREEDLDYTGRKINIKTTELKDGMYFIKLGSVNSGTVSKRFVIAR